MCEFAYEVAEYSLYHGPVSLPCFKAPMMQDWLDFTRVSSRTNNKTGQTRNAFCPGHCLSLCPLRVYVIVFRARTRQVTLVANVLPRLPRLHFSTLVPPTDRNTHQVQALWPVFHHVWNHSPLANRRSHQAACPPLQFGRAQLSYAASANNQPVKGNNRQVLRRSDAEFGNGPTLLHWGKCGK